MCCGVKTGLKEAKICMLLQADRLEDFYLEFAGINMLARKRAFVNFALTKLGYNSQHEAGLALEGRITSDQFMQKVRRQLHIETCSAGIN